jgi:hypothetical protein
MIEAPDAVAINVIGVGCGAFMVKRAQENQPEKE